MLKHNLKSRQIPRGKQLDYFFELGEEMKNKGQLALTIDIDRLPKKDLSFLENFQHLTRLTIRGGTENQIKKLSLARHINDLCLLNCKVNSYDFLSDMDSLEILDIRLGGAKNYSSIGNFSNLKAINFMKLNSLKDISFITNLKYLQFIRLDSCSNIKIIPDLTRQNSLKRVELDTMKRLNNICGISKASNLEELIVILNETELESDSFKCFLEHKTLKHILPGIGSTTSKKSIQVNKLLQYQLMSSSDFIGGKYEYFEIT